MKLNHYLSGVGLELKFINVHKNKHFSIFIRLTTKFKFELKKQGDIGYLALPFIHINYSTFTYPSVVV